MNRKIVEITTFDTDGYSFSKKYVDTPKGLLPLTILSNAVIIKEKVIKKRIIGEIELE